MSNDTQKISFLACSGYLHEIEDSLLSTQAKEMLLKIVLHKISLLEAFTVMESLYVKGCFGDDQFEVSAILEKLTQDGAVVYKVAWAYWPELWATWEPSSTLRSHHSVLKTFQRFLEKKASSPYPKGQEATLMTRESLDHLISVMCTRSSNLKETLTIKMVHETIAEVHAAMNAATTPPDNPKRHCNDDLETPKMKIPRIYLGSHLQSINWKEPPPASVAPTKLEDCCDSKSMESSIELPRNSSQDSVDVEPGVVTVKLEDTTEAATPSPSPEDKVPAGLPNQLKNMDRKEAYRVWQEELNRVWGTEGRVWIENTVDEEEPPYHFEPIAKCVFSEKVSWNNDPPPLFCDCATVGSSCFQQRRSCCPSQLQESENGEPLSPYTRQGLLRESFNDPAIFECNQRCTCNVRTCPHRATQRGETRLLTIFRTPDKRGWGVKTREMIPRGAFVCEYVGEIVTCEEAEVRGLQDNVDGATYLFDLDYVPQDEVAFVIDARHKSNISRFLNHSCDPNLTTVSVFVEHWDLRMPHVAFFATRAIQPGEELTLDYCPTNKKVLPSSSHLLVAGMVRVGDKLIALFEFIAQKPEDLTIKPKEILTVVSFPNDPKWVEVQNEHGERGIVPVIYTESVTTASKSWFCPDMSRSTAEKALRKRCDGTFLIRLSNKFVGNYTLSVVHNHEVQHYRVEYRVPVRPPQIITTSPTMTRNGAGISSPAVGAMPFMWRRTSSTEELEEVEENGHTYDMDIPPPPLPEMYKEYCIDPETVFYSLEDLIANYRTGAQGLCHALTESVSEKAQAIVIFLDMKKLRVPFYEVVMGAKLGSGEFADVYKAEYKGGNAAVKCLRDNSDDASKEALLQEAYMMYQLNHSNIIRLLGFYERPVKDSIASQPSNGTKPQSPVPTSSSSSARRQTVALVLEYMSMGSLQHYLQSRGRTVVTPEMQLRFAKEVVDAMVYLEERGFVHRDLAARNILLNENLQAKVSDFGMMLKPALPSRNEVPKAAAHQFVPSRRPSTSPGLGSSPGTPKVKPHGGREETREWSHQLEVEEAPQHVKRDNDRLPVKWSAPEAIKLRKFSNKSDVWSYGILLWEIYSFGRMPYPQLSASVVGEHVEKGYRMDPPPDTSPEMSKLMRSCWAAKPEDRPSFSAIHTILLHQHQLMSSS